jgi:hypothetical protein
MSYNVGRVHQALRVTPAMAAEISAGATNAGAPNALKHTCTKNTKVCSGSQFWGRRQVWFGHHYASAKPSAGAT